MSDLSAAFNTILVGSGIACVSILLAIPIAWSLSRFSSWAVRLLLALASSLFFVPLYVQAAGWSAGFGLQGWITISQTAAATSPWLGKLAVVWMHGLGLLPFGIWLLTIGLTRVSPRSEHAALDDSGFGGLLRYVIWPECRPWLAMLVILAFAVVSGEMLITNLYQVFTLTEKFYLDCTIGEPTVFGGLLTSVPSFMVTLLMLIWLVRNSARLRLEPGEDYVLSRPADLGRLSFFIACLILFFCVGVPFINLVVKAGWEPWQSGDLIRHRWNGLRLLESVSTAPIDFAPEFRWSLVLGSLSATLAILASLTIALAVRTSRWFLWPIVAILAVGFALPGPAIYQCIKVAFGFLGPELHYWIQTRTLAEPIVALQFRCLPLGTLMAYVLMDQHRLATGGTMLADELGWSDRLRLFLGQNRVELIGLWILAFAVSIADLSTTVLLLPPGVSTLASRIFELLHYGVRYKEAGLCLVLFLGGYFVGLVLLAFLSNRLHHRTR
jgi:iron(III) transport system permease protein